MKKFLIKTFIYYAVVTICIPIFCFATIASIYWLLYTTGLPELGDSVLFKAGLILIEVGACGYVTSKLADIVLFKTDKNDQQEELN